jgi:cobalt/nickel transport system permease protein
VRGAGATFLALFAGNLVMIGIVLVSGIQGVTGGTSALVSSLLLIGAINLAVGAVEAVVTGYLVAYLARVRPDILGERPAQPPAPGTEGAHL